MSRRFFQSFLKPSTKPVEYYCSLPILPRDSSLLVHNIGILNYDEKTDTVKRDMAYRIFTNVNKFTYPPSFDHYVTPVLIKCSHERVYRTSYMDWSTLKHIYNRILRLPNRTIFPVTLNTYEDWIREIVLKLDEFE
jgi:hypothetical protein